MYQMDSEPGNSEKLAKRNLEEMPHKSDSNQHKGEILSLNQPMCLSTSTALFFLPNKHLIFFHYFTFVEILFCKPEGQGLVTDWSRTQDWVLSLLHPNLSLWLGTEPLLQVAVAGATWDHIHSKMSLWHDTPAPQG